MYSLLLPFNTALTYMKSANLQKTVITFIKDIRNWKFHFSCKTNGSYMNSSCGQCNYLPATSRNKTLGIFIKKLQILFVSVSLKRYFLNQFPFPIISIWRQIFERFLSPGVSLSQITMIQKLFPRKIDLLLIHDGHNKCKFFKPAYYLIHLLVLV